MKKFEELEIGCIFQWYTGKKWNTYIKISPIDDGDVVVIKGNNPGYIEYFCDDQECCEVNFETY